MTKEDLIVKIQEKCTRESFGWWIFKIKSRYKLTKTEPHFTIQSFEQLPDEFTSHQVIKPDITLNREGVTIREHFYPWSTILVTALVNDNATGFYLVLGLENGELAEGSLGTRNLHLGFAQEFSHMVELYKRYAEKERK